MLNHLFQSNICTEKYFWKIPKQPIDTMRHKSIIHVVQRIRTERDAAMTNAGTMKVVIEGFTMTRKVFRKPDGTLWCWWCNEFIRVEVCL